MPMTLNDSNVGSFDELRTYRHSTLGIYRSPWAQGHQEYDDADTQRSTTSSDRPALDVP